MQSIRVHDFNLTKTLECGQLFRYEKNDDSYLVCHKNSLFSVTQNKDMLLYKGVSKRFLVDFFGLGQDYKKIIRSISKDTHINKAIISNYGLRLVHQDPWECLISYVCSSNSNIPKITKNVRLLSTSFGEVTALDGYRDYTFPRPGTLCDMDLISRCKVGYRAAFIHKINSLITYRELLGLRKSSYPEAKEVLMELPGVGDKIADCVCLFSLGKLEAFPVDVWIKRAIQEFYFSGKDVPNRRIREFASSYFGEYAGYANQFLFYYRRMLR